MVKNRNQIKETILRSAKKIFAEKGYDSTNIQDIVKEANVNIAMISYYFGGKEYLYQEVFKQFCISQKIPNYLAIFPDEPTKALESYLMYIFDHLDDDPEIALITYQEILAPNARFLDVIPYIKSSWQQLQFILQTGKEKKEFNFTSLSFTMHWISSFVILPKYQMFLTMALDENIDTITNREKIDYIINFLNVKI
ncbi:TetR/AcrR family transcriptional regulator [Bacillus thuringiensis]|uniref:TetR/AcrR family transcriptional regulator n=1 Tax=Bacillus thuringiensis TaxID=1428 RepID=UPI003B985CAE